MTELNAQTSTEKHASGANDTSRLYRALGETFAKVLLDRLSEQIICIVLYGSVARGRARPESDIDLFVVAGETDQESSDVQNRIGKLDLDFWDGPESSELRARGYRANIETLVVSKARALRGLPIYLDMTLDAIVLHDPAKFFVQRIELARRQMAELRSYREWIGPEEYFWHLKADAKPGEVFELPYIERTQK